MFLIKISMSLFSYLNAEGWTQSLLWNILLHLFFRYWQHWQMRPYSTDATLKPLTSIILMFILVFTWYHKGMSRLVGCVLLICLLALTELCLINSMDNKENVWYFRHTAESALNFTPACCCSFFTIFPYPSDFDLFVPDLHDLQFLPHAYIELCKNDDLKNWKIFASQCHGRNRMMAVCAV